MYIVVKGTITVVGSNANNREDKKLTFTNNAPLRPCISKINATTDNAEELSVVMPMYNLLEYYNNYSMISESLWNYCRDEVDDNANENNADNHTINNKIITSKSFEYNTKLIGSTTNANNTSTTEVVVSLKYLSNF